MTPKRVQCIRNVLLLLMTRDIDNNHIRHFYIHLNAGIRLTSLYIPPVKTVAHDG